MGLMKTSQNKIVNLTFRHDFEPKIRYSRFFFFFWKIHLGIVRRLDDFNHH